MPVYPIITLANIIEYLTEQQQSADLVAIVEYRSRYGISRNEQR
jgi:hypothetical protein